MKKLKLKKKNILLIAITIICVTVLIWNAVTFIRSNMEKQKINEETKIIEEISEIQEIEDTEEVELVNPPENKPNDYWDYIKLPLMSVNLNELKNINKDTVGFISVAGTNINYPVVQANDNKYYLEHSFQKKYNGAGWVFMDYRNHPSVSDRNTVIYGHALNNDTIFGSLKNILNTSWVNDKNNYIIKYVSEHETMLFQVFAVFTIPKESYYIQTSFSSDTEYKEWLDTMIGRSKFNFNTTVDENDSILTLSTCKKYTDGKERVVMQAKLIKKDHRN